MARTGQGWAGVFGQVRIGYDRSGQDGSCQDRSRQARPDQDRLEQVTFEIKLAFETLFDFVSICVTLF